MMDEPDHARLKALSDRIAKAKTAEKPTSDRGKGFSQGEVAWRMIIELVSGLLIGLGIGFGLDALLGTRPILLVLFTLLGFAAGVKTMLGTAKQMAADLEAKQIKAAMAARDEGE